MSLFLYFRMDPSQVNTRNKPTHIVVVDDEASVANFQAELLRLMEYRVSVYYDAIDAYSAISRSPRSFDLLITDQTMPGMVGTELITKTRKLRPDLPIVLCTGFSEYVNEANAPSFGIDAFLTKPVDSQKFLDVISTVLASGRVYA